MPDDPTLQAQPSATEPSTPAVEENKEAEKGETPKEAQKTEVKDEVKEEKPLSEAEKTRLAMQKRIDRQTAANRAAEERIRQLTEEVTKYKERVPKTDSAPKQDDYKTYEEYEEALVEWRANQKAEARLKEEKEKELKEANERKAAETKRVFEEKEAIFRKSAADYDRVAGEAVEAMNALAHQGANIGFLQQAVLQFENPPEIIYHLGKDTNLIEDMVQMSPLQLMRALVKLETTIEGSKTQPAKAPEPIKPVGGKGGGKPLHERSGKEILKSLGVRGY